MKAAPAFGARACIRDRGRSAPLTKCLSAPQRIRTSDLRLRRRARGVGWGSSGSHGGGRIREQRAAGFQPLQAVAENRQHFAASLLHGAGGLRAVDGGTDRLLSVRQVAERLGVCTATVYTLCERNELAHIRVLTAIRIAPADLARFVAAARRGR